MTEPTNIDSIRYFGNYLILGEIARGGMGVVYLAQQTNLNREVALKLVRAGNLASPRELQLFQHEAEAAAALSHPNIVRIYETGTHEGQPFVAMELIEGESLAQQLVSGSWQPDTVGQRRRQRCAAELIACLASAVQHAHERGVIHRDLKPDNVLMNVSGQPVLADFGLARLTESNTGLTQTGQVIGTAAYMSPEQASGRVREITTATDVYALGAVFHELLTGQPPFAGASVAEILNKVLHDELRPLSSTGATLDRDLETICLKCLEKEPARRYATACALRADLERWLRGEIILARPTTLAERFKKWVRRHPAISILAAVLCVGATISAGAITWQWQRAERGWAEVRKANTRLLLQRAEEQFERNESSAALATLARAVRDDPRNRLTEERLVNALRARRFLIPLSMAKAGPTNGFDLSMSSQALARRSQRGTISADASSATNIIVSGQPIADESFTLAPPRAAVIRHVSLSPDARLLAAAVSEVGVCIWDLRSRTLVATLPHPIAASVVEFDPLTPVLITGADDGKLRWWDWRQHELIREIVAHRAPINALCFTTNGMFFSAGEDGVLKATSVGQAQPAAEPVWLTNAIDQLSLGPSHQLAVRMRGNFVRHFSLPRFPSPPDRALFNPALADHSRPSLQAIESVLGLAATNFHTQPITFTNLAPNGRFVVTASMDGSARVWDARTRQPATPPMVHAATVNHARFSPGGQRIATSTADQRVRVWDAMTGLALTDSLITKGFVFSVRFSADGREIIASNGQSWPIHQSTTSGNLDWLPTLAEALAGQRLSVAGVTESIPHEQAAAFCRQLSDEPAKPSPAWLQALLPQP